MDLLHVNIVKALKHLPLAWKFPLVYLWVNLQELHLSLVLPIKNLQHFCYGNIEVFVNINI